MGKLSGDTGHSLVSPNSLQSCDCGCTSVITDSISSKIWKSNCRWEKWEILLLESCLCVYRCDDASTESENYSCYCRGQLWGQIDS